MNVFDVQPLDGDRWPEGGLEFLGRCPVCGSERRELEYEGLRDIVFGCAPGRWTIHRCCSCGTGYLDPRPNEATIGLAYKTYFTHSGIGREAVAGLTPLQFLARALANGYRNRQFGTMERPAIRFGAQIVALWPPMRRRLDQSFRCLTRLYAGRRVLDVGCGGGNFLYWARAMRCRVAGSDPDPVSVAAACKNGFEVRQGGIEAFANCSRQFDVVCFAHVVEHLHDPISALRLARSLLRPGGELWLETPNFASLGRRRYGAVWRGLEVPRHLAIFTPESLRGALEMAGFNDIRFHRANGGNVIKESKRLAEAHPEVVPSRVLPHVWSRGTELLRVTCIAGTEGA
ncbi:class I SAM-dependent methyltransferase [Aromatoleum toluclasticum]|uniref:class I SAM-dependent methyltransferase n=1 Tax=Aromatoleum toluclasticum TaxID=92003 RepID=UPI001D188D12|nr:class I SAM-dependent methyltransferase [Aromatoleum toluclasticum]MCC4114265.1 class I SAM-dependent methyltransferase [Aromatoleum toluclasticum]